MNKKLLRYVINVVFITWIIAVAVFSFISFPEGNGTSDKWVFSSSRAELHAAAYFIGAFLFYYVLNIRKHKFLFLVGILVFLFGLLLEIVQIWLPSRSFNPMDIAGNGMGVVAFILIWSVYSYFKLPDFSLFLYTTL